MKKTIGFIGCGNMGSIMVSGIASSNLISDYEIICSNKSKTKLEELHKKYNIKIATNNIEVANCSDVLILAIKPNVLKTAIEEIRDSIKDNVIIVSIVAGKKIEDIKKLFNKDDIKVVRAMPNIPSLVGEGMATLCGCPNTLEEEIQLICSIFNSFGKCEVISEDLMDVVTGVSGSSPAFIFMIIESLADGAVLEGLPREMAYKLVAQTVLGSAKMILETGKHPGELKDMVCSPKGTTIEGVASLEKNGLRASLIEAVKQSVEKSKAISK